MPSRLKIILCIFLFFLINLSMFTANINYRPVRSGHGSMFESDMPMFQMLTGAYSYYSDWFTPKEPSIREWEGYDELLLMKEIKSECGCLKSVDVLLPERFTRIEHDNGIGGTIWRFLGEETRDPNDYAEVTVYDKVYTISDRRHVFVGELIYTLKFYPATKIWEITYDLINPVAECAGELVIENSVAWEGFCVDMPTARRITFTDGLAPPQT